MTSIPSLSESVDQSVLCWLATVSADGQPNVSPKELFVLHDSDELVIANVASPQSARNVAVNPQVCVSFIDVFVQKGQQVKGKARLITEDAPDFNIYASPLQQLAGDRYPFNSVFVIKIEKIKPIIAPSYLLYPATTEADQIASAKRAYGVG